MTNRSGTYGKIGETLEETMRPTPTLPLEGGGKGVGVKGLTGIARRLRKQSTDTERHLWRHLRDRQIEGFKFRRQQTVGRYVVDVLLTPHPDPLPQGERQGKENDAPPRGDDF
jgi:hypothetical protein